MSRQLFGTIGVPAVIMAALLMAPAARAQFRLPGPPPRPPAPPAPRPPAAPIPRPAAPPAARPAGPPITARPPGGLPGGPPPRPWGGDPGWHGYRPLYAWGGYYSSPSYSPSYFMYYPYSGSYGYDSNLSSGSPTDTGASSPSYQPAPSSPASGDEGATNAEKEGAAAERHRGRARRAFRTGDYAEAQRECERAIRRLPGDANLHEFLALCQFAQGSYKDAAATLYEVLPAEPRWDWDSLMSFYASARTYTTQLRALEQHVRENPGDAAGRFVLAYHYLTLDDRDAAAGQLRRVIKLQPRDRVSPGLLEELEKASDGKDGAPGR